MDDEQIKAFRQDLDIETDKHIKEYGISVMAVFPEEGTNSMGFAYTIGLAEVGEPELIAFGLSPQMGQYCLNQIYKRWVQGDLQLIDGEEVDGMFGAEGEIGVVLGEADISLSAEYLTSSARRFALYTLMTTLDAEVIDELDEFPPEIMSATEDGQFAPVKALQVVIPDTEGKFPWEKDCDPRLKMQPNLRSHEGRRAVWEDFR
jgi:hypothetical protein